MLALYRLDCRHNYDRKIRIAATNGVSRIDAGHPGHLEGRYQEIEILPFEGAQRFGRPEGGCWTCQTLATLFLHRSR
ncbi:MAG: hypothetical protein WB952_08020 [Terriglobales bacterium]